jgi:hypothetical protein
MRGVVLAGLLGLIACAPQPQTTPQQAQAFLDSSCPPYSGSNPAPAVREAYGLCLREHMSLLHVAVSDQPSGGDISVDRTLAAFAHSEAIENYDRLWQPHYGYSSGYNPIAPTTQLNW